MAPTRWGIASAGLISRDFASVLTIASTDTHVVGAVAARSLERAQKFAEDLNIPKAYGSYQQLADDPNIDVVYVGTIPGTHYDLLRMMILAGKPVLSEKPACITRQQAAELIALAREKRVLFVEGMWTTHFPVFTKLRQVLEEGSLGDPLLINYNMGFNYSGGLFVHDEIDWRMKPECGGGIGLAFGIYAVALARWVFKDKPQRIQANGNISPTGCDETCVFTLDFSNNRKMMCTVSSECFMGNLATVSCKKGCIQIPEPWCPIKLKVKDDWHTFPLPETSLSFNYFNCPGFLYEADHVRELLLKGSLESTIWSHDDTLYVMSIIDEIRRQMGVLYPGEH